MIYSMTAFARAQNQSDTGTLVCELRSINHRYLEFSLHLPEALRPLEMSIREGIRNYIKRGKVDCTMRYQASSTEVSNVFTINSSVANAVIEASEKISDKIKSPAAINPIEILRFPGVIETTEADFELLQKQVLSLLNKTLEELVEARSREGEELKQLFLQRMQLMQAELAKVRAQLPSVITEQHNRIIKRFSDAKVELDPSRLEQEMVLFTQKIDITEEIERAETHINEIKRILQQGGAVGRRFDFLLQELNREANTLGSKSVDPVITHAAVEMKVLIEQVREQVQNVE